MKHTVNIDENNVELSIHKNNADDYVIVITDKSCDNMYNFQVYKLDFEDIDEIIKQLKVAKKEMLSNE